MAKLAVLGGIVFVVLFAFVQYSSSTNPKPQLKAVAVLRGDNSNVKGVIHFEQNVPPQSNLLQVNNEPVHVFGEINGEMCLLVCTMSMQRGSLAEEGDYC